jgi:hypothetical protein
MRAEISGPWVSQRNEVRLLPQRNRRQQRPCLYLLAVAVLGGSGCATIVSGRTEMIRFESMPTGATAYIDNTKTYTTPAAVELSRQTNHRVEFSKPGYVPVNRQVLRASNPWLWGNLLIGGIIGLIIDYNTGASNDLEPDLVLVELVPVSPEIQAGTSVPNEQSHAPPLYQPAPAAGERPAAELQR